MAKDLADKNKQLGSPKPDARLQNSRPELSLIQLSTIVYSIMTTIGMLISLYGHHNFFEITALPESRQVALKLLAVTGIASGILLIFGYLFEEWFPSFRAVKEMVTDHLGPYSLFTAFYLAAISAIGEEFLFRAAIQPFTGIMIASIFFALLHIGPDGRISTWSLWALIAGLFLGWMYESSGSIFVPIGAHFCVNFFSIARVQRHFRARASARPHD